MAIGQPFSVALTCAVLETDAVRVVPDESPLAVATVQLAPFELVGGSHPADLRSGARRFFQYDYTVRIIDANAIGKDVNLPFLTIHYRIESRVASQPLEGRDRLYLLPPLAVRVLSTVPVEASDIRDASDAPFGAIEALRFRSRVFAIVALALAALGAIVLVPAIVRAFVGAKRRPKGDARALSDRAVLGQVAAELDAVRNESRGGWTPDLLGRALTSLRVAGAYAVGQRARQRVLAPGADAPEARLLVRGGWFGRRRAVVASPITTEDLAREIAQLPLTTPQDRRQMLDALHGAISTLTGALYSARHENVGPYDDTIDAAIRAVERLRRDLSWPRTALRSAARP